MLCVSSDGLETITILCALEIDTDRPTTTLCKIRDG